jgi:DNA-binding NtrC family response regulator
LRVLENKQFERVGDSRTREVDVRLVFASNKNLKELAAKGAFRQDLYYRINVVTVNLPPLRERDEDVPILVDHFMERFREETGKPVEGLSQGAMDLMIDYPWPGNVRELENAVGHAFVHCSEGVIRPEHLPRDLLGAVGGGGVSARLGSLEDIEKEAIADMLRRCKGNRSLAARRLGIGRSSLWRKLKKYGLDEPITLDPL